MKTQKPLFFKLFKSVSLIIIIGVLLIAIINIHMLSFSKSRTLSLDEAKEITDADCIVILGCGIINNKPGLMLKDRLDRGIELYNQKSAPKIIMSGDHGQQGYDEVNVMKSYALENKVPSQDVFMDHAGFSTYESMYRAKVIFEAEKIIIVTQEYHLPRAIYIAEALGLDAVGVAAKDINYRGQALRDVREVLARTKDFFNSVFKPEPTYLGEAIPVSGDGNTTND